MIKIDNIEKNIESLSNKAEKAEKAIDVLQLTQAALNLVNVRASLILHSEKKEV